MYMKITKLYVCALFLQADLVVKMAGSVLQNLEHDRYVNIKFTLILTRTN